MSPTSALLANAESDRHPIAIEGNYEGEFHFAGRLTQPITELRDGHALQAFAEAHPDGLVAGDIQSELGIPNSTLSHHLEKLKNEELVNVRRESTFLRYTANTQALQELLQFLYAECCTRNKAVKPQNIVQLCK